MGIQINGQTDTIRASDGSLSIGGTVSYEDVSNITSVGLITARSGLEVGNIGAINATILSNGDANFLGSVGIGTASPVRQLQLGDNTSSAEVISLQTSTTGNGSIYFGDSTADAREYRGMLRYSHSDDAMLFWTSATEAMRIDSDGRLLVGLTSDLSGGTASTGIQLATAGGGFLGLARNDTSVLAGNSLGGLRIYANDPSGYNDVGIVQCVADGDHNLDDYPTRWEFHTTADGDPSPTERMRIESDGDLILGDQTNYAFIRPWDSTTGNLIIGADQSSTGTNGSSVVFRTRGGEKARIDSSGNVGIGETSAQAKLHVKEGNSGVTPDSNRDTLFLEADGNAGLTIGTPNANSGYVAFGDPEDENAGQIIYRHSDDSMSAFVAGEDRMRIDSDGRLLVGMTTAIASGNEKRLQIVGDTNAGAEILLGRDDSEVQSGNVLGALRFFGNDSNGTYEEVAKIQCHAEGSHGTGNKPGQLRFFTSPSGQASPTERMRIEASGNIGHYGNSNDQGTAQKNTVVKHYPAVLGTKLLIPFVSQGNLNSTTICKVWGHGARFNNPSPGAFEVTFAVGHLTSLSNLTSWGGNGNYSSITINGMNIEITFTSGYTSATADGVFVCIEYMTNNTAYSIDTPNIAMN